MNTFKEDYLKKFNELKSGYTLVGIYKFSNEFSIKDYQRSNCNEEENIILNKIEKDLNIDYGYLYNLYKTILRRKETNYKKSTLLNNLIRFSYHILKSNNIIIQESDEITDFTAIKKLFILTLLSSYLEYIYFNKSFSCLELYYKFVLEFNISNEEIETQIDFIFNNVNIGSTIKKKDIDQL